MKRIFIALLASIITLTANATDANENISDTDKNLIMAALKGWNVRLSAGYNLGGTAPLPLPVEIRGIEGFNPGLNLSLKGSAEKMFGKGDWGLRFGI